MRHDVTATGSTRHSIVKGLDEVDAIQRVIVGLRSSLPHLLTQVPPTNPAPHTTSNEPSVPCDPGTGQAT